ncbi:MAG TPA: glycosyltransferase [Planctomycetaceae bacterium]|nr:glycosyltransferase [Planctomycetaceae bacterium]
MNKPARTALLVAHTFPPIAVAGVFRILRFVKYLPEWGWRPVVVASPPRNAETGCDAGLLAQVPASTIVDRPQMFDPEAWLGNLARRILGRKSSAGGDAAVAHSVAAARQGPNGHSLAPPARSALETYLSRLQELLFRTPDENVWWVLPAVRAGLREIKRTNPELIYTTGPPHSTHLAGLLLHLASGLPWVADFRDPWSRLPWGQKRNLWGARLLPYIEAECVRHASCVILNTGRMAHDFQRHYHHFRRSKFVALPNGFDPELRSVVGECLKDQKGGSRRKGAVRLCHAGTLYHQRDIRALVDAVRQLSKSGVTVHFENIGFGGVNSDVEAYVRESGLAESITFEDPIPHRDVLKRMAQSDVLVVIQPNNELQVPGKLYEMMLFAKPMLALADEGELADLVRRYELGEVARSSDANDITRAIGRLATAGQGDSKASRNGRTLDAFDGRLLTKRLAAIFEGVVRDFGHADIERAAARDESHDAFVEVDPGEPAAHGSFDETIHERPRLAEVHHGT